MNVSHLHPNYQLLDDVPDDLDPEVNPIVAAHWFGLNVDNKPPEALTAESLPTFQRRVA